MTRYLSNGLRILTAAALTSGLAVSAMAQTAGTQPGPASTAPAKTAPVVEMKKDAAPATAGKTGTEVKGSQDVKTHPSTASTPAKPATGATTQHESKASTTTEKKPGG
jgi:poly(3-hydroxybutyrate) depolymerase